MAGRTPSKHRWTVAAIVVTGLMVLGGFGVSIVVKKKANRPAEPASVRDAVRAK